VIKVELFGRLFGYLIVEIGTYDRPQMMACLNLIYLHPTCFKISNLIRSLCLLIQVVNEILTDIEDGADFRSQTAMETLENAHSVSTSTSRSLVVDVHLPPGIDCRKHTIICIS
jgi:hypothetical protein